MGASFSHRVGRRLIRLFCGIAIGWVLVSLLLVAWLAIGSIHYGDADTALHRFPREGFSEIIVGTMSAGGAGCWVGALIAPVVLGASRFKYAVVNASVVGGAGAALIASFAGFWVAEAIHVESPKSLWVLVVPTINGILFGIAIGWKSGRHFTDRSS
jgi:hypothetical protein